MSSDKTEKTLRSKLEPAASGEAKQLSAAVREQIKSIADPYRSQRGQLGLFSGTQATDKTLAARVLAAQLGYDAYRVDLAAVASKYIGETEKNLSALLDTGEARQAVLLFDEADSLFGKRTNVDSADERFANQETNYLLQRVETFDGLIVLATNSRSDLDDAVLRRLTWSIDFTPPAASRRPTWWQRVLHRFGISR